MVSGDAQYWGDGITMTGPSWHPILGVLSSFGRQAEEVSTGEVQFHAAMVDE